MSTNQTRDSLIVGQKYAFATASLILGIVSFVNLLGLEKPILAIVFGWLALRANPQPLLKDHRVWAKTGVVLGTIVLIVVPTLIILNFHRLQEFIQVLSTLNSGR